MHFGIVIVVLAYCWLPTPPPQVNHAQPPSPVIGRAFALRYPTCSALTFLFQVNVATPSFRVATSPVSSQQESTDFVTYF